MEIEKSKDSPEFETEYDVSLTLFEAQKMSQEALKKVMDAANGTVVIDASTMHFSRTLISATINKGAKFKLLHCRVGHLNNMHELLQSAQQSAETSAHAKVVSRSGDSEEVVVLQDDRLGEAAKYLSNFLIDIEVQNFVVPNSLAGEL